MDKTDNKEGLNWRESLAEHMADLKCQEELEAELTKGLVFGDEESLIAVGEVKKQVAFRTFDDGSLQIRFQRSELVAEDTAKSMCHKFTFSENDATQLLADLVNALGCWDDVISKFPEKEYRNGVWQYPIK